MNLSVIVPIFNEEVHLWPMAESLATVMDQIAGPQEWGFVLVDNGSRDHSPNICKEILNRWPQSLYLSLNRPNYGEALHCGLVNSTANYAFIINVDFWDERFMAWSWNQRENYDLILGSKRADTTLNQQSKYRKTLSWGLNSILQFAFGYVGSDTHGQKFLNLKTMKPILSSCIMRRGQYDTEFTLRALRAGLRLAEVPVPIVEVRRQRNWLFKKIFQNLFDILRLKRSLNKVKYLGPVRYHRYAREDLLS
jgi:glycosyltransferase involved in cell wall biosynthesis